MKDLTVWQHLVAVLPAGSAGNTALVYTVPESLIEPELDVAFLQAVTDATVLTRFPLLQVADRTGVLCCVARDNEGVPASLTRQATFLPATGSQVGIGLVAIILPVLRYLQPLDVITLRLEAGQPGDIVQALIRLRYKLLTS